MPPQLTYVDLQDGPSSLQVREGEATLLERGKMENFYEQERQEHMLKVGDVQEKIRVAQEKLNNMND